MKYLRLSSESRAAPFGSHAAHCRKAHRAHSSPASVPTARSGNRPPLQSAPVSWHRATYRAQGRRKMSQTSLDTFSLFYNTPSCTANVRYVMLSLTSPQFLEDRLAAVAATLIITVRAQVISIC